MYLFVYGTLKRGHHNHYLLEDARFVGETILLGGHDMYSLGGFPGIVPGTSRVHGEVYEITEEHLPRLDRLEGYRPDRPENSMYTRQVGLVPIVLADEKLEVFVYIWNGRIDGRPKIESGVWE